MDSCLFIIVCVCVFSCVWKPENNLVKSAFSSTFIWVCGDHRLLETSSMGSRLYLVLLLGKLMELLGHGALLEEVCL